ncbi:MAG: hypothetical protein GEU95_14760 [Rhizobiales bacterium]|nr:hypothetical protein [Hyphomicrobiales bacterium]
MIIVVILSLVLGVVLGRRFMFFVLIPAVLIVEALIVGMGVTYEYDGWIIIVGAIVAAFALQVGYLIGAHYRAKQAGRTSLRPVAMLRPPFESSGGAPTPYLG